MKPADIRDYVSRDWGLTRELKDRYWAERKRALTPGAALGIGDRLRDHARSLRPDWPAPSERETDLRAHERVSESLRRVVRSDR